MNADMTLRVPAWGFTLIEMLLAVSITAILMTMALPSFVTFIANNTVRSTTDNILAGLQHTRVEAVRQNTSVNFLIDTSSNNWGILTGATSGVTNPCTSTGVTYIQRSCGENGNAILTANGSIPSSLSCGSASGTTNVATIGGDGRMTSASALTSIDICLSSATVRRRIEITTYGQIKQCDPLSEAGDVRNCGN